MALKEYKLIQLTQHISYLPLPTNIGVIALPKTDGSTSIYLIDSGNDAQMASQLLDCLNNSFSKPVIKTVINTHSHADHCGGNTFLKEKTGCTIWASKGEAAIMECPDIETGLIWGGSPVKELKNSYFVADSCTPDYSFKSDAHFNIESLSVQAISLKGHYIDPAGFVITDTDGKKVCFAGDALSGRNVIRKYWIQYLFDEKLSKDSLAALSKVDADFYVPGHGQCVDAIEGLVELNQLALLETEDMILDELKTPKTAEEVLKAVADRNGLELKISNYVLIGCTLRSYLSSLCDEGKIKYEIKENLMYWSLNK